MPRSKVGRTRTFTGCRTCRRRHTKCDEGRPSCRVCGQSGLNCDGYGARLQWASDNSAELANDHQASDLHRLRYPLFSDFERQSMSDGLSESLGSQTAEDVLADLDAGSRRFRRQKVFCLFKGPFGAFRVSEGGQVPDSADSNASPSSEDMCVSPDHPEGQDHVTRNSDAEDIENEDWMQQLDDVDFDTFDVPLDFILDQDAHQELGTIQSLITYPSSDLFASIAPDPLTTPCVEVNQLPEEITKDIVSLKEPLNERQETRRDLILREPAGSIFDSALPEEASSLLRHYKQHIDATTAALKAKRQSPWQLMFLPCAFQTFAELSLLGTASHTRVAVLCALLARSAFKLYKTDPDATKSNYWRTVGSKNMDKARYHLQRVLDQDMTLVHTVEYEELLMAFLAMSITSLYHDGRTPQNLLLDAEKLIRLRKSFTGGPQNVRILHHVYTYLRVIVESTSTCISDAAGDRENEPHHISPPRTFRISEDSLNVGLDPTVTKTAELGYGDIHLEVQGLWEKTLHSTIHGIPESLMTLLAQTISLANEKKHLETGGLTNSKVLSDLKRHTQTLEKRIWSWQLDFELAISPPSADLTSNSDLELIHHPHTQLMILAVHRALVIYFYRRVHDVSAMVLQDNVRETIEFLEPCIETLADDDDFTPSLAWAAFVSASEAIKPELQQRALKCVTITDNQGFHYGPKSSAEAVMSIWAGRQST
ncbi:fungal-specific transcription factor domain-containing protein [Fusarium oxysporum]|nr:fungal-specific transcription factor domain-containing protein [Fusarium oxysporum]